MSESKVGQFVREEYTSGTLVNLRNVHGQRAFRHEQSAILSRYELIEAAPLLFYIELFILLKSNKKPY